MLCKPQAAASLLVAGLLVNAICCSASAPVTSVRLAGTVSPRQGRLEVEVGTVWYSAFCQTSDPEHGDGVATVVCRQLGYPGGRGYSYPKREVRAANGTALIGSLSCTGTEARLADCNYTESSWEDCYGWYSGGEYTDSEAYMEAVVCDGVAEIQAVRLVGGRNRLEGNVEVKVNGSWSTICDATDHTAGSAICRQLGSAHAALYRGEGFYGSARFPALLRVDECNGNETKLGDCKLSLMATNTSCAVGLSCTGGIKSDVSEVRLVGGRTDREGRLEVLVRGQWGTVCNSGWAAQWHSNARLVCRQLGMAGGAARVSAAAFYGKSGRNITHSMKWVDCSQNASTLSQCSFSWTPTRCEGYEEAVAVACSGANTIPAVKLVGGPNSKEGRLLVQVPGKGWSSVGESVTGSDAAVARVACRQMGMAGGAARGYSFYGFAPEPALVEDITCKGNESTLSECTFSGTIWGDGNFGVACQGANTINAVRLMNGNMTGGPEGRLEVLVNTTGKRQWGTVCNVFWFNQKAAKVACRQLGWSGGRVVLGSKYAKTRLPIPIMLVECTGQEASLSECSMDKNEEAPVCEHSEDVGLVCTGPKRNPVTFFPVLKKSCTATCTHYKQLTVAGKTTKPALCKARRAGKTYYGTHIAGEGSCLYRVGKNSFADTAGYSCGCTSPTDTARLQWTPTAAAGVICPAGTSPVARSPSVCRIRRPASGEYVMGWVGSSGACVAPNVLVGSPHSSTTSDAWVLAASATAQVLCY